jgi:hypothetical protein
MIGKRRRACGVSLLVLVLVLLLTPPRRKRTSVAGRKNPARLGGPNQGDDDVGGGGGDMGTTVTRPVARLRAPRRAERLPSAAAPESPSARGFGT